MSSISGFSSLYLPTFGSKAPASAKPVSAQKVVQVVQQTSPFVPEQNTRGSISAERMFESESLLAFPENRRWDNISSDRVKRQKIQSPDTASPASVQFSPISGDSSPSSLVSPMEEDL